MDLLRRFAAAALFVVGSRRRLRRRPPEDLSGAGARLMLLGAGWGLALVGIWQATYDLTYPLWFIWVVPSAACAAATLLVYHRGFAALARPPTSPRPWLTLPAAAVLAAAWAHMLNEGVRYWDPDWPVQAPRALAWLWPRAVCRVLLLAPVWGSWSMLVLGQFHRPGPKTGPHTRVLAATTGPLAAAAWLALPLAGSFVYLMFVPLPWRFLPPAAAVAGALGGGTLMVRARGGLTRDALLAANVAAQTLFLLAYLLVR